MPETRDFEIEELLIDVSVFPSGWYVDWVPSHGVADDRGQLDDRYIQFRAVGLVARSSHAVYRYRDDRAASYWYRENLPFGSALRLTPWEVPGELQYESPVADQFQFACADFHYQTSDEDSERLRACLAAGQYEEYISIFSISMSLYDMTEHMPYSDLERILKAIDDRMARYFGKDDR